MKTALTLLFSLILAIAGVVILKRGTKSQNLMSRILGIAFCVVALVFVYSLIGDLWKSI